MKIIGLIIDSAVISSLGEVANLYIIATELTALDSNNYITKFVVFKDYKKEVQVGFIFKDNVQIGTTTNITLGDGVEASTTSILKALKTHLEAKYEWTITEDTI